MPQNRYGRNYWLGAAAIVLVLFAIVLAVVQFFGITDTDGASGLIAGMFVWPALIIYHVLWTRRTRRASRSK